MQETEEYEYFEEAYRQPCDCMARQHNLINNCLNCGKIICDQEGEGPCFFCGNFVFKKGNEQQFEEGKYLDNINEEYDNFKSYQDAINFKERLLDFDRNQIATKNVVDEETDWYEIKEDIWQDQEVRKLALQKALETEGEEERLKNHITYNLDIKTGKIEEIQQGVDYQKEKENARKFLDKMTQQKKDEQKIFHKKQLENQQEKELVANIEEYYFTHVAESNEDKPQKQKNQYNTKIIQHDEEYSKFKDFDELNKISKQQDSQQYDISLYDLEHSYDNIALSIWQPWAQLVISGIKRFEGRDWYTDYRGPLWIHSSSHTLKNQDIINTKKFYKEMYKKKLPKFPENFPENFLIGVVDLQDVWTYEEYKKKIPSPFNLESKSQYIFVFRNPRKLQVPIKMKGAKNFFDVQKDIINKAKYQIEKIPTNFCIYFSQKYIDQSKLNEHNFKKNSAKQNNLEEQQQLSYELLSSGSLFLFKANQNDFIDYFINKDIQYGKQLQVGYQNLKNFQINDDNVTIFLQQIAKKYSEKNFKQSYFSADMFRLKQSDRDINLQTKYLFFFNIGKAVRLQTQSSSQKFLVTDENIIFNDLRKENITILHVDKKKQGKNLQPLADYVSLSIGIYQLNFQQ